MKLSEPGGDQTFQEGFCISFRMSSIGVMEAQLFPDALGIRCHGMIGDKGFAFGGSQGSFEHSSHELLLGHEQLNLSWDGGFAFGI